MIYRKSLPVSKFLSIRNPQIVRFKGSFETQFLKYESEDMLITQTVACYMY